MVEDITPSPPGNGPPTSQPLNLVSTEPPPVVEVSRVAPQGEPFDPEPHREIIRGKIALRLLWMLAGVLLLAFISMWFKMDSEVLRTVLTIIFGPLVTLVSAATGFYYGSRSSSL